MLKIRLSRLEVALLVLAESWRVLVLPSIEVRCNILLNPSDLHWTSRIEVDLFACFKQLQILSDAGSVLAQHFFGLHSHCFNNYNIIKPSLKIIEAIRWMSRRITHSYQCRRSAGWFRRLRAYSGCILSQSCPTWNLQRQPTCLPFRQWQRRPSSEPRSSTFV